MRKVSLCPGRSDMMLRKYPKEENCLDSWSVTHRYHPESLTLADMMVKEPSSSVLKGGDSMSAILIFDWLKSLIHEGWLQGFASTSHFNVTVIPWMIGWPKPGSLVIEKDGSYKTSKTAVVTEGLLQAGWWQEQDRDFPWKSLVTLIVRSDSLRYLSLEAEYSIKNWLLSVTFWSLINQLMTLTPVAGTSSTTHRTLITFFSRTVTDAADESCEEDTSEEDECKEVILLPSTSRYGWWGELLLLSLLLLMMLGWTERATEKMETIDKSTSLFLSILSPLFLPLVVSLDSHIREKERKIQQQPAKMTGGGQLKRRKKSLAARKTFKPREGFTRERKTQMQDMDVTVGVQCLPDSAPEFHP